MATRRQHKLRLPTLLSAGLVIVLLVAGCTPAAQQGPAVGTAAPAATASAAPEGTSTAPSDAGESPVRSAQGQLAGQEPASYTPNVALTLQTGIAEGHMVFVGVGGAIDGVVNPKLQVSLNDVVQITLIDGEGATHDIVLPDFGVASEQVTSKGASTTVVLRADKPGEFAYFCSLPGHRQAGMEGVLAVGDQAAATPGLTGENIVADPAAVPAPVGDRAPQTVRFELETVELEGQLAEGTTFTYWTFNGTVPGPMMRVRVGDTVEVSVNNAAGSKMIHSIDLHAVTGPGGGAEVMQVSPGQTKSFTFKALNPGLYVYHCATPMVAAHIANGMYGLILVEPEGGLPPVNREFYVMQGEIYTRAAFGQHGHQEFDVQKLLDARPEYFVLNGAVGALTQQHPLRAEVGETVRIFFGVGGPNLPSSFHVIGEIFDRVYDQASLTADPLTDVQTTLVPPGGAAMVEFKLDVPGRYILVDHALARLDRGLVGFLVVEGPAAPDIFKEGAP
jgi:nitrite reductase (NO-forming)